MRYDIIYNFISDNWTWSRAIDAESNYYFCIFCFQIYQIEYVIVKAANSPRPAAWILEKSLNGENFQQWQYYAPSDEECWARYSAPPVAGKPVYIADDEVICTSQYSRQTPMENGEVRTHFSFREVRKIRVRYNISFFNAQFLSVCTAAASKNLNISRCKLYISYFFFFLFLIFLPLTFFRNNRRIIKPIKLSSYYSPHLYHTWYVSL